MCIRDSLHQADVRARFRRAHLEDLAFDAQLVARPHRQRPAELVEPGADDAAGGPQVARHQQLHGHGGGVPAARRETAEYRALRGCVVQVERLRVELGGEALDPLGVDAQAPGAAEFLTDREILEVAQAAGDYTCLLYTSPSP